MRSKFLVLLFGLLALALPACGGGGGGGGDVEPVPPTIASLDPARGPTAGGNTVLIQGSGFEAEDVEEVEVTFDGIPAVSVTIISDSTLSVVVPANTAGNSDVQVTTIHGTAELSNSYFYVPPPIINFVRDADDLSFDPEGLTSGGKQITIQGVQLHPLGSGLPRVFFGDTQGSVIGISNNLLQVTAPEVDEEGLVDIRLVNDFGETTEQDAFRYIAPRLYFAEGKGTVGSLYEINLLTNQSALIGQIGYSIDGMAMSPDGIMYAVTRQPVSNSTTAKLLVIDLDTGEGSEVADLFVAGTADQAARVDDLTFVGDELYGWARNFGRPVKIDTQTGSVEVLGAFADIVTGVSEGIAADANDNVLLQLVSAHGSLWTLDVVAEQWLEGVALTGQAFNADTLMATMSMTFAEGKLHAIISTLVNGSAAQGTSYWVEIDPVTGELGTFINLGIDADAIASNSK